MTRQRHSFLRRRRSWKKEKQLADAKEQTKENTSLTKLITKDLIKRYSGGENFSMPAGYLQEGEDEFLVVWEIRLQIPEAWEELVILDLGMEGQAHSAKDVADISTRR